MFRYILMFVVVFQMICLQVLVTAKFTKAETKSEPEVVAPQLESAKPPARPMPPPKVEPPKPKFKLPVAGQHLIALPNAKAYILNDGKLREIGRLRSQYLDCIFLKEMRPSYWLIRINQAGFQADTHIIHKDDLVVIEDKLNQNLNQMLIVSGYE